MAGGAYKAEIENIAEHAYSNVEARAYSGAKRAGRGAGVRMFFQTNCSKQRFVKFSGYLRKLHLCVDITMTLDAFDTIRELIYASE